MSRQTSPSTQMQTPSQVFLAYIFYGLLGLSLLYSGLVGIWWEFIFPALAILLAVYFRRTGDTARQASTFSDPVVRPE